MLTKEEITQYSRQLLLPEIGVEGQLKLKDARVLVVGAGGLGCPVLIYLASSGVGTLGIADFDVVDKTNLHRQILYNESSVGKLKTEEAEIKLRDLNPNVTLNVHQVNIDKQSAENIFPLYDIIVDGTDNFLARVAIDSVCKKLNKPMVFGAVFRFQGQVAVFNFNGGPSYSEIFSEAYEAENNCSFSGVLGVVPAVIGTLQANEVIKIITGVGEILSGKMLVVDLLQMKFEILEMA